MRLDTATRAADANASSQDIDKYLGKVSGPLLDRVDIIVEVPAVKFEALSRNDTAEPSSEIKKQVDAAREIQNRRFAGTASAAMR